MSNFVYDLTTLPSGKTDLVPLPPSADLTQYLPAAHWNTHVQASYDVRAALRTGVFQGLAEQASDPTPVDSDAYWWLQNTGVMRLVGPTEFHFGGTITAAEPTLSTHLATRNYVDTHASISPLIAKGDLYTRTATVDARIGVGTNGKLLSANSATTTGLEWIDPPVTTKTLQGAYTDGGTGPQVINLSTSGKGIKIRDTVAGIGEALFAVQNSTGVTSHLAVNSDGTVTMAGALTVTGVVSGGAPTADAHLTTKLYVDGLITGLNWKAMVRLASTVAGGNVTLSGDQSVDGFTTTELDRVLLKNQTNHVENGIWIAHTGAAWTRATDMPAGSHGATATVFVDIGTANEDTSWFCYTDKPTDVVGTDAIDFQVFSNTISMHNALTGLDGGTSGQYYHLTSAQHAGLVGVATGGVAFASSTGVLATDASNFFWDNTNKQLGIGTATPGVALAVFGAAQTFGDRRAVIYANDSTTSAIGTGGGISFGGKDSAGVFGEFAGVKGIRENNTVTNWDGALVFYTRCTARSTQQQEAMRITSGASNVSGRVEIPGSIYNSTFKVGTLEVQGYALNNCWFGDNVYFDNVNFQYRATGYAAMASFHNGMLTVYTAPSGSGVATMTLRSVIGNTGDFALGGAITSDTNFTGATLRGVGSLVTVTGDLTVTGGLGLYSYTAGETLAQYDVVYAYCEGGTSGRLKKATNAAESTSRVVGVVVTGNTAGNAATIVMAGVYKMTFTGTAPAITDFGKPVYLSGTAGAVTLTAPGTGTVLLRVGYLVGIGAQAEVSIHIGDEFQQ